MDENNKDLNNAFIYSNTPLDPKLKDIIDGLGTLKGFSRTSYDLLPKLGAITINIAQCVAH